MKVMKKIAGVILAVAMIMAMGIVSFADGTNPSITVAEGDGHTYSVYQIFTGTFDGTSWVDLKWGQNGTGTVGNSVTETEMANINGISDEATEKEKSVVINGYLKSDTAAIATVSAGNAYNNVPTGYYLIKDNTNYSGDTTNPKQDDATPVYAVVEVKGNETAPIVINRKAAKPTVDKFVYDDETSGDKNTANVDGWYKNADHEINESFQFKLVATLTPDSDYAAYESYKVVFHDTMSTGITFEKIDSVKIDGKVVVNFLDN